MQPRFACLYVGAVLKAFSPGQLRPWRRSMSHPKLSLVAIPSSFPRQPGWCWTPSAHKGQRRVSRSDPMPNNWLKQDSYPSTHGIPITVVLIPSSPCLLQPTDVFTQPINSLQGMLNLLLFWFLYFSDYVIVGGKWSFTCPSALPVGFLSIFSFWRPSCNPGLISFLPSPLLAPVCKSTSSDLNHSWRYWFCLQGRCQVRLLHSLCQNVI